MEDHFTSVKLPRFQRPPSADPIEVKINDGEPRVLDLLPGARHDPLRCTLAVHSLIDSTRSKTYDALSFVWGPFYPEPGVSIFGIDSYPTIQVNGVHDLPITINLWYALRRIREHSRPVRLWMDQICINQSDLEERKHQVAYIGDIFRQAQHVYLWFGEVHEDNMLTKVEAYRQVLKRDSGLDRWWTRAWMIKEFVFASEEPIILFGPYRLSWEDRCLFLEKEENTWKQLRLLVERLKGGARFIYKTAQYSWLRDSNFDKNLFTMAAMLYETETTDPRDFVFCILPSITEAERAHIAVDYTRPANVVFAESTFASIASLKSIDILSLIDVASPRAGVVNLPSWAVDFTFPSKDDDWRLSRGRQKGLQRKILAKIEAPMNLIIYDHEMYILRNMFDFATDPQGWTVLRPEQEAQVSLDREEPGRLRLAGLVFDSIATSMRITSRHLW